jgi:hypothetical protein
MKILLVCIYWYNPFMAKFISFSKNMESVCNFTQFLNNMLNLRELRSTEKILDLLGGGKYCLFQIDIQRNNFSFIFSLFHQF